MVDASPDDAVLARVRSLVRSVLNIERGIGAFTAETRLLGALPELDSMAAVAILTELEECFGFEIEDEEVSAAIFDSLGSLAAFVQTKLNVGS